MQALQTTWTRRKREFDEVKWDFADGVRAREFHPYPARYIPDLPRAALKAVGASGTVLDPFCGSGTTLYAARQLGLPSIGSDLSPVAALISTVRAGLDQLPSTEEVRSLAASLRAAATHQRVLAYAREIPRIDHWFSEPAMLAMEGATRFLRDLTVSDTAKSVIGAGISAATVRVSRQESDTRYAALENHATQDAVAKELERSVLAVWRWVTEHYPAFGDGPPASVFVADARNLHSMPDGSAQVAVFSPPYPNAYEYWLYHKYRAYWLGFDPIQVRAQELGARPHYSRANGLKASDFERQMSEVFTEIGRVLVPDAATICVVGDSRIAGELIDNGALLTSAATSVGFELVSATKRRISSGRSSFNRDHAVARTHEHVLLLRSKS